MPIDTASALFTLTAVCAVLVVGISKSGFGAAFGSLAVPLLALVTTPSHAAALLLPSLLVMDLMGLVVFRRSFDRQLLKLLFPPAMLGIAIGFLTFRQVSAEGLKLILGVVSVCCSCCSAGSHPNPLPGEQAARCDARRLWARFRASPASSPTRAARRCRCT